MHALIGILVKAKNRKEALRKGALAGERLVDLQIFDYYLTFDDDAARQRWGNYPPALSLKSKEGRLLLQDLIDATKRRLFDNLDRIRAFLSEHDNEDIWYGDDEEQLPEDRRVYRRLKGEEEISTLMFRYFCASVGEMVSSHIHLYDEYGRGLWDLSLINQTLENANWIVPLDVHY